MERAVKFISQQERRQLCLHRAVSHKMQQAKRGAPMLYALQRPLVAAKTSKISPLEFGQLLRQAVCSFALVTQPEGLGGTSASWSVAGMLPEGVELLFRRGRIQNLQLTMHLQLVELFR
jgi:hypothetical protein